MKNFGILFLTPRRIAIAIVIISFIGFLDAVYLTAAHYFGLSLRCAILQGCDVVTTSEYSKIFEIPVALLGTIYYAFVFLAGIAYLDMGNSFIIRLVAYGTIIGFLASLWFIYVQVFILEALCLYCIISAITSTALFILGMILLTEKKIAVV